MNMFRPVSCINLKEEDIGDVLEADVQSSYNGPIVILENTEWTSLFLFFPISKKNMDLIIQIMSGSRDIKPLSIYKTMIDSWKGSGNFLSGIVMDLNYEPKSIEQKILVNLALSGDDGKLKSFVPVSFVDAIITSILLGQDVMVGNKLLALMVPDAPSGIIQDWDNEESHPFPVDSNLKGIVKDILEGKIKDNKNKNDKEE